MIDILISHHLYIIKINEKDIPLSQWKEGQILIKSDSNLHGIEKIG